MKALLAITLMSGILGLAFSAAAETEPQQLEGAPIERAVTEAGSAECESGLCDTQHNSDIATENAEEANKRARTLAGTTANGSTKGSTGPSNVTDQ